MDKAIADELSRLRYHIKLMQHMVKSDEHMFFMSIIDYDINETQVKAIQNVMSAFSYRLKESTDKHFEQFHEDSKNDPDSILFQFGVDPKELYLDQAPSMEEFSKYVEKILPGSISPRYLLMGMKNQSIHTELCEYLLA
ncbi:hypothetical protein J2Z48_000666 [Croceifilum oryzae]|uniref:Uncharacterized protein n=1 Tax=Croceifilum oryzae TaxID=1553429 RepID=A0AAJ1TDQ3_9BACL|nr:DUF1878 family protein [Croceifilum oryzae]MDQ0416499.1 hypothetical protein [Croceifilum oryzae]